jgi:hypothetical protein
MAGTATSQNYKVSSVTTKGTNATVAMQAIDATGKPIPKSTLTLVIANNIINPALFKPGELALVTVSTA